MYRRLVMIGVLVSVLLFVLPEEKAYACTVMSPMEIAEVIVAGRVTGWEYVGYDRAHYYSAVDMRVGLSSRYRLQIEIEVDEMLKGKDNAPTHSWIRACLFMTLNNFGQDGQEIAVSLQVIRLVNIS